ncbi:MAG: creatininase family protein, partial [Anaerolineae bacterium]|nr:creatininase family protein [Anaerolineae bacterium]
HLQDLNWMDVEHYLEHDNRIILITGATEQHAYLSLMTDILIPTRLAFAVAEREGVLIAPPFNFGVSGHFTDFPGTITLSQQTFELVLGEMVDALMCQGFERFFVINGHGGNKQPQRLKDMHLEGLVRIVWYDWWRENASREFQAAHNLRLDHANWGENFPFTRVAEVPSGSKPPVNLAMADSGQSMREVLGAGNYGGIYQVDDGLMEELFMRVAAEISAQVRALRDA